MDAQDQYTKYLEDLIITQYQASGVFTHAPTAGDIREDFIRQFIEQRKHNYRAVKGQIALPGEQTLEQCDIAIQSKENSCLSIGSQYIINPFQAACLLEVKTSLKYADCTKLDKLAARIKSKKEKGYPKIGLFAYGLGSGVKKKNLLKRFGYSFDKVTETYFRDKDLKLHYPNVDFLVCLDMYVDLDSGEEVENKVFLQKDQEKVKDKIVEYFYLEPVNHFKKFVELIDSLK